MYEKTMPKGKAGEELVQKFIRDAFGTFYEVTVTFGDDELEIVFGEDLRQATEIQDQLSQATQGDLQIRDMGLEVKTQDVTPFSAKAAEYLGYSKKIYDKNFFEIGHRRKKAQSYHETTIEDLAHALDLDEEIIRNKTVMVKKGQDAGKRYKLGSVRKGLLQNSVKTWLSGAGTAYVNVHTKHIMFYPHTLLKETLREVFLSDTPLMESFGMSENGTLSFFGEYSPYVVVYDEKAGIWRGNSEKTMHTISEMFSYPLTNLEVAA